MIKQNIVFIENKAGSLQKVTGLLKDAGIDIYGFDVLMHRNLHCSVW